MPTAPSRSPLTLAASDRPLLPGTLVRLPYGSLACATPDRRVGSSWDGTYRISQPTPTGRSAIWTGWQRSDLTVVPVVPGASIHCVGREELRLVVAAARAAGLSHRVVFHGHSGYVHGRARNGEEHNEVVLSEPADAWLDRLELDDATGEPPKTRTIDACSLCGAQVEPDDDGPCCSDAKIVQVEILRPLVALGVPRPPIFGTIDDLKRLGLVAS